MLERMKHLDGLEARLRLQNGHDGSSFTSRVSRGPGRQAWTWRRPAARRKQREVRRPACFLSRPSAVHLDERMAAPAGRCRVSDAVDPAPDRRNAADQRHGRTRMGSCCRRRTAHVTRSSGKTTAGREVVRVVVVRLESVVDFGRRYAGAGHASRE